FHLAQKLLASGLLGLLDEIGSGKAELFHGESGTNTNDEILKRRGLVQGFPKYEAADSRKLSAQYIFNAEN
ncbi:MAG: hypothetical protein J0I76_07125, partial [Thiobacillus sp.]|nr:hypothetical protein [Thiobacillus sp.]